jgi:hypothetical protein
MALINRTDGPVDGGMVVGRAVRDLAIFPPVDPLAGGGAVDLSQPIPVYRLHVSTALAESDALAGAEQIGWRYLLERGPEDVSYADVFLEDGVTRFSSISRNRNARTLLDAAHRAAAFAADVPGDCEFRILEAPGSRMSAVWLHCDPPHFIPYIDGTPRKRALLQMLSWPEFRSELLRRLQPKAGPDGGQDHIRGRCTQLQPQHIQQRSNAMADLPDRVIEKLDPTMQFELFDSAEFDGATYYFVDQFDEFSGEMVIVRDAPGQMPRIVEDLPADAPLVGGGAALSPALQERLRAYRGEPEEPEVPGADDGLIGGGVGAQQRLNAQFHNMAVRYAGTINESERLISRDPNAPGTNNGKLACAWAVNRVAKDSLGKEIGGGLATAEMVKVLDAKHTVLGSPEPGCVIISPTVDRADGTRNIGHVGVVGLTVGGETLICSNSSSKGEFQQNWTLTGWNGFYGDQKGLKVRFFNLAPGRFPALVG